MEAIFLEALPGCELWRSRYSPFSGFAQFTHAVRLIRMPISSFHRLADQLGDPQNVTFLSVVGRSGSTLLTQMFEQTGEVVSISEPAAFRFLAEVGPPHQARREPQRGPGNHYRGALSQHHSVCSEIETGRKRKEGCLLAIRLGVWGRHKLPQMGPGRSPGRKWILCTFEVRNKPSGTPFFSIFER